MTDRTTPDAHPLRSGDPARLGGYEILGRLGEGGQGAVFLGRPTAPGARGTADHVAIKLLHGGLTGDESARARFVRELEVAKRVARFCTAQVLDADVAGDQPYIVSEYVPGLSLHRVVREEGPRTGGALERLAVSTLTALTAIHQAGIVHRDFKPHNVMMGPDGPRVIDFGVARALGAAGETQNVGTPAYMAPEHFTGGEVGPASDMFAWGTTMVFAATGRPAFGNDEMAMVMHRILTGEPDLGDLPNPMREVVLACLEKEPGRRLTARQAQERLVGAASGATAVAPSVFPGSAGPAASSVATVAMAGTAPPADPVTDPSGPRTRTAPQPPPYGDTTPHSPYGHGGPGTPPPPGRPPERDGEGKRRARLVPLAAAAAVAALLAGGGVWAATRSDGGGGEERPLTAPEQQKVAPQDGTAGKSGPGEATKKPGSKQDGKKHGRRPDHKRPGDGKKTSGPGPATAPEPPNKYTPQAVCNTGGHGGGYYVQRSVPASGGTVYLLYNSSGYNCAVTMKTVNVGKKSPVSVWIQRTGGGQINDGGAFEWYAGPVFVSAPSQCVRFGGDGAESPWGNCG
ncbi:serine/threonine protein kinase [Actinomadura roseirufa]|uniref:serine/threonine protein kinase n=1 Tax=Actinomadura roseirufa TaxID=2094049 RepID=UPI001F5ED516|nr:serine/threonine-protein kinase [Actinomadura roseirufa]